MGKLTMWIGRYNCIFGCHLAFLFRICQKYELTMIESIEMRNYSNLKGVPSCYANGGPFVIEIIAETVTVFLHFFTV